MKSEIIIIGGGIIGITFASILAKSGINTILFEKKDLNSGSSRSDGRASAITARSKLFLEKYGLWDSLKNYSNPIEHIKIIDDAQASIYFQKYIVDSEALGYMIENHHMIRALYDEAQNISNLKIMRSDFENVEQNSYKVVLRSNSANYFANLLIGADGKFSKIRKIANIGSKIHKFNQTSIVCNVNHDVDHQNIAYEKFSPQGPFAILPLSGGKSSSIVWVEKQKLAKLYLSMNQKDFLYHLKEKFGSHLGNINISSRIYSYDLSSLKVSNYYNNRIALIGDAAHSIHPLAGQGLNLGLLDVEILSELIIDAKNYGLDIGSELLNQYQKLRESDNINMLYITSTLNAIFSNNIFPVNTIRKFGINVIESLPIAKKFFMKYAMGFR